MTVPNPTPIFRFIHIDNLRGYLDRGGLCAPNHCPNDGQLYRTIHNEEVQNERHVTTISCGPGGTIHDYVPFYFGYLSPMLLNLKTGRVPGYDEGQAPLIYLVSTAQAVRESGAGLVLSNGHGLATFTEWFDDLAQLDQVDWNVVYQRYWSDTLEDMDRQRRKQAEFLVHRFCDWSLIQAIGVINQDMKARVEDILVQYPAELHKPVVVHSDWYYY
jgi:hypothetical protein